MRNIFLENHAQNVVKKLVPDPFLKSQNCSYLCINRLCPGLGLPKYIETKVLTTCLYFI